MTISAIVIAKNEEKKISSCLRYLKFTDEIIFVDNGSTDKTVEIAQKFSVKSHVNTSKDFSVLRNFGRDKASSKWLLYLDADEQLTKELIEEIEQVIKKENNYSAYSIHRKNYYYGKPWPQKESLVRLIKKDKLIKWQGSVHETALVDGRIGILTQPLLHYTHDDLGKMIEKTNEWSEIEARLRFKKNHPKMTIWRFVRVMMTGFSDSYFKQGGWKTGMIGLIESIYQSFSLFITYAKLWELQTIKKDEK